MRTAISTALSIATRPAIQAARDERCLQIEATWSELVQHVIRHSMSAQHKASQAGCIATPHVHVIYNAT